jgi:histidyl-tRNA synthetase
MSYSVSVATALRESKIRTQIYTEKKKFKAKIGYADKLGFPFAIFLGGDEEQNGVVTLKKLSTGEQSTISIEEAINIIKETVTNTDGITVINE